AYEAAAFGFQAQQNAQNFVARMNDLGLTNYVSCTWTRVAKQEAETKLDGEIVPKIGPALKCEVTMVRDAGKWKVFALRVPGKETAPAESAFATSGRGVPFQNLAERPMTPASEIMAL